MELAWIDRSHGGVNYLKYLKHSNLYEWNIGLHSGYDADMTQSLALDEVVNRAQSKTNQKIILTERDRALLLWMGEQFAIRFDHIRQLAALHAKPRPDYDAAPISYKSAHNLTSRWLKAGLVERRKVFSEQPMWVWLTPEGCRVVGLDLDHRSPAISRLNHIHAVNCVRLHVEKKLQDRARWVCEREANVLRKLQADNREFHLVDGEVEFEDGHVAAVEVELTQKSYSRLDSILKALRDDYDTVWYFAAPQCYNAVQAAIKKVRSHEETFILHPLSLIIRDSGEPV